MPSRFAVLILLLSAMSTFGQPADKADLTLQAKTILRKYCVECHHPDAGHSGDLNVVERSGLDRAGRLFLTPGSADASQIVQLVEDGSMPPGANKKPSPDERRILKEWINAQASAYPKTIDENYILSSILADVKSLGADRTNYRYMSLHSLLPQGNELFSFAPARDSLAKSIAGLSAKDPETPKVIDAIGAVVRVDLRRTGWDLKPFWRRKKRDDKEYENVVSDVNVFDVILMEYALGRMHPELPVYNELVETFLKPTAQALPIVYLRGEWFTDQFAKSPVARELRSVFNKSTPPDSPPLAKQPIVPFDAGVAILDLDSEAKPNFASSPEPFAVLFETRDVKAPTLLKSKFTDGDRMLFYVRPTADVFFEIIQTDAKGERTIFDMEGISNLIGAREDKMIAGRKKNGYRLEFSGGEKDYFTIVACDTEFPQGDLLVAKDEFKGRIHDRVLHRFYPLDKPKMEFNPTRIVKKTISIEVQKKP